MKWMWGLAFVLCDVVIVTSLLVLLCSPARALPKRWEWLFPLRGRWAWYLLVSVVVLAYASLAPVSLMVLIRTIKR
jgi:hypothetical protein